MRIKFDYKLILELQMTTFNFTHKTYENIAFGRTMIVICNNKDHPLMMNHHINILIRLT